MSGVSTVVIAGLDPAIHPASHAAIVAKMDARVEPAHDGGVWGAALPLTDVIPGRTRSVRTRNLAATTSGFRVCALRAHPGMTNERLFGAANAEVATVEASGAEVAGAKVAKAEREIIQ
ncbi:hypothetical protein SR870_02955 [Rhodopseudomonas palustris]|uniref:hypothetical protein n=1 Tax=Rhodopseudomonas palustris TaxID=1076 RepID=UPI002ACE71BE|nr:hypothetical protein [Rhodopseudomonas palustris]WQH00270.1 hypothetical protein SR870_02955 [Rhodopseudomonas palustris]